MIEIQGALHLHTTYSDGGSGFPSLISAAQAVGLDYLIVTDHMTLKGKEDGYEGLHDTLLVIVGYEHHDANKKNHYLAIGTDTVVSANSSQAYIDEIAAEGGIGFLAHPMERRHYFKQYPPYPWTDWDVTGYDGIEVWNQMSEWVEKLKTRASYARVLYPRRFLTGICPPLKKIWDEANRTRFVSGVGGVDAHNFRFKLGFFSLQVFPVKVELKAIRTHLFVDGSFTESDAEGSKHMVLDALRNGRGFVSNYRRGDATGTTMSIQYADGQNALPGRQEFMGVLPAHMEIRLPLEAEVKLIRNGDEIQAKKGTKITFAIDQTGVYRVEAFRKKRAWIYSNPFPIGTYPF